ncbi:MAG: response regulator [Phycisphaerales bacterium]|nr:MAG: response regulator [Phycisphaerales bacterium]
MADDHNGTVLIIEDESELRFILTAHLRAAGFAVLEAADGVKAIELATSRQPDVIIMDIGLPLLDGLSATRTLKADDRTAHIPVIMLTARSGAQDIVRGLEAGAQEYLPKPFDVAELLARVRTVYRLAVTRKDLDKLNSRLEVEVDVKTKRLQVLYEFMRDLNNADSRDQILNLLIRCVELATGAKRISLFLTEATGEYLVCERAVGIDPSVVDRIRIKDFEGITGQIFRSGKTLAAKTYDTNVRPDRKYHRDTFLSTPLVSTSLETREGVIGVLNVTEKADDSPFSEEEIECIRSVADAAAIALDNVMRRMRLRHSVRVLLQTLGHLAEYRDEETTLHIDRVTKMARLLAEELRREGPYAALVTDDFVDMLVQAAPMHDIGKVGIPDDILVKPGRLSAEEFQIMKTHTDIGRRVLSRASDPACPVPLLEMCIDIAYCHHERYDGTGYPRRLPGQDIPLAARIIALVDAYDAMTSHRRYKEPKSHEEAVETVRSEASQHFDPVLAEAFLRCRQQFNEVRECYDDSPEAIGALLA